MASYPKRVFFIITTARISKQRYFIHSCILGGNTQGRHFQKVTPSGGKDGTQRGKES
jgi:hypothetical protein